MIRVFAIGVRMSRVIQIKVSLLEAMETVVRNRD
jgi:hypothetical protein